MMNEYSEQRRRFPNFRRVRWSIEERDDYIYETFLRLLRQGYSKDKAVEYIEGLKKIYLSNLSIRDILSKPRFRQRKEAA